MSTRSRIGIKRADGSVTAIYCHSDGYIEYVGLTLYSAYQRVDKIEKLVSLGAMSTLGYIIGDKIDFDYSLNVYKKLCEKNISSFEIYETEEYKAARELEELQCRFYNRDRGEPLRIYHGDLKNLPHEQYDYIYDVEKGYWLVRENVRFTNLEKKIQKIYNAATKRERANMDAILERGKQYANVI